MIHQSDLTRVGSTKENHIKIERKLRRKEGILTYEMMRKLTTEIRRLQKCNEYLIKKLKEATSGKSKDSTSMEMELNGLSVKISEETPNESEEKIIKNARGRFDEDKD